MNSYLPRYLAVIPILAGAVIMVLTIIRHHQLMKYSNEETYESQKKNTVQEKTTTVLLYVFLAGFFVGFIDILLRGADPMYFFITLIFLLGSLYIFFSVRSQASMEVRLREKTMETMRAFVSAIEMKDSYTRGHSEHVYRLVSLLYDTLDASDKNRINKPKLLDAAMLHDIGKISIKDEVLNKSATLSDEEYEIIKTHPLNGKKMLENTCYRDIADWVLYHHERMDSQGYYGLDAHKIPIESRLIAVVDTYSALCTDRVYRRKKSHEEAIIEMREAAGAHLDEALVEKFLTIDRHELERILPEAILSA